MKTQQIAEAQEDLTMANAVLNDDRVYLKDLTSKCEIKAKEWDQRSSMRSEELAAITQALAVIEGVVATKADATGAGGRAKMGEKSVQGDSSDPLDFVQTTVTVRKAQQEPEQDETRMRLMDLLSTKA